ncbi:GNAT family N-acetyltransferase [Haladaptatus halobius]|uniref:GNAT family N-acetyltransferase n=1 Tax=Haladaptatus halobius TaxID=2884875 RepID=UPI001D0B5906|nr:GNAT family N-acetyltransferase [Haladaptatus halobius]
MPEYRPVPADEEEYRRLLRYAFRPEAGPELDEDDDEPELGDRRGLFEGDDLRCVCKHYWFTARVRGDWHDVAGLSAVASPPENRRRGLVAQLLAESLSEYRENEVYFSALWPFDYGFYRRYGWGTVTKYTKYETTPDALALDTEPTGEFRRLEADDWRLLEPVLDAHGERYTLTIDRTEEWWRHRVFEGWQKDPYVYAWMRDGEEQRSSNVSDDEPRDDEARGYVVYTIEEDGDDKRLRVWELAYADDDAYCHLLRFVQYHDSQVERVRLYEPENTDLLDVVDDPRKVECEVRTGPMFRLVDVQRALESLSYPDDARGRVVLQVSDPLAEWNEGTFELVTDEVVRCDRIDAGDDFDANPDATFDIDATTDVNTLSQLVAGYYSVEDGERLGDLVVVDADARDRLATLFPKRNVFLREGF